MTAPTAFDHLLAVAIGLVLPAVGALQRLRGGSAAEPSAVETGQKIATYWSNAAFQAVLGAAALAVWWHGGRSWHDLGLTARPERLAWGLALAGLLLAAYAIDTRRQLTPERLPETKARWRRDTPFMPATPREMRHSLVLLATAPVVEEILYRGFLIAYVSHFTGTGPLGLALAVAVPALIFGVSHAYQGARAILKILVLATGLGAVFVVTDSLWIPIALHLVVDLVGILLGPKLLAADGPVEGR